VNNTAHDPSHDPAHLPHAPYQRQHSTGDDGVEHTDSIVREHPQAACGGVLNRLGDIVPDGTQAPFDGGHRRYDQVYDDTPYNPNDCEGNRDGHGVHCLQPIVQKTRQIKFDPGACRVQCRVQKPDNANLAFDK